MFDNVMYLVGQFFGIVAVILGFVSYQMKKPSGILFFQIMTGIVFTVHYLLIGAMSAAPLNLLCSVACVFYYFRDKKGGKGPVIPIVFSVLIAAMGLISWDSWHSLLITVGLVINSLGLTLSNAQKTRMSVFIKSPLCLAYNIIVASAGGIIYECVVLTSAIIGLIKNRQKDNL